LNTFTLLNSSTVVGYFRRKFLYIAKKWLLIELVLLDLYGTV